MLLIVLPVGAFESSALSNLWTLNSDTAGSVIRFLELVTFDFTNSRLRHPKLLIKLTWILVDSVRVIWISKFSYHIDCAFLAFIFWIKSLGFTILVMCVILIMCCNSRLHPRSRWVIVQNAYTLRRHFEQAKAVPKTCHTVLWLYGTFLISYLFPSAFFPAAYLIPLTAATDFHTFPSFDNVLLNVIHKIPETQIFSFF